MEQTPGCDGPAEVAETHISTLFLVGRRAYKVRKPVAFGFVDFRTRAAREEDCHREVLLNRRLAPDVYLGVADVIRAGAPCDHMVVMARLPQDRNLAAMAQDGADLDAWMPSIAGTLARFHAGAERSAEISTAATAGALQQVWDQNMLEARPFVGSLLDTTVDGEIAVLARRWIQGRVPLLRARAAAGRTCDGHGDLQAADIFCLDDGVRILDCLEFSDRLRWVDVAADLAFLVMDLERLGRHDAATLLSHAYRDASEDGFPLSLLHHYCASRAYVRATVACLRADQGDAHSGALAQQFHTLAHNYLQDARISVVVIGGSPGSGKSTLARALAEHGHWAVLHSDAVRREITGGRSSPMAPGTDDRYDAATTAATYREVLRRAEALASNGTSVILDASWTDGAWRAEARSMAQRTASDLVEICCRANPDVADRRILARLQSGDDPSEATPRVRQTLAAHMDPWPEALLIDTSDMTRHEVVEQALQVLPHRKITGTFSPVPADDPARR